MKFFFLFNNLFTSLGSQNTQMVEKVSTFSPFNFQINAAKSLLQLFLLIFPVFYFSISTDPPINQSLDQTSEDAEIYISSGAMIIGGEHVYVVNLEGMNAAATSDFRRQAFKQNITLKVVKNTLLQKAMEQMEGVDYSEMFQSFKGNSALMISETAIAPAKLIQSFRKKEEKPALKSAFVQETFYLGDNNLDTLVNIKSREEMIGEIIGLLQSPIQRLVSALQNKEEATGKAEEAPVAEVAAPAEEPKTEEAKTEEAPAAEAAPETPEASAEGEAPAAE